MKEREGERGRKTEKGKEAEREIQRERERNRERMIIKPDRVLLSMLRKESKKPTGVSDAGCILMNFH